MVGPQGTGFGLEPGYHLLRCGGIFIERDIVHIEHALGIGTFHTDHDLRHPGEIRTDRTQVDDPLNPLVRLPARRHIGGILIDHLLIVDLDIDLTATGIVCPFAEIQ